MHELKVLDITVESLDEYGCSFTHNRRSWRVEKGQYVTISRYQSMLAWYLPSPSIKNNFGNLLQ